MDPETLWFAGWCLVHQLGHSVLIRRVFGHRETQTQREECHVKGDAEIGVILLQYKKAKDS